MIGEAAVLRLSKEPIAYPRDERYMKAAMVVRASRAAWFLAVSENPWNELHVRACHERYVAAVEVARAEEDRITGGRWNEVRMARDAQRRMSSAATSIAQRRRGPRRTVGR